MIKNIKVFIDRNMSKNKGFLYKDFHFSFLKITYFKKIAESCSFRDVTLEIQFFLMCTVTP